MSICLINPPQLQLREPTAYIPLGLAYVAAKHPDCSIVNWAAGIVEEDLPACNTYGITCQSATYNATKEVISTIRRLYPSSKIIIGGVLPSVDPGIAKTLQADYLFSGLYTGIRECLPDRSKFKREHVINLTGVHGSMKPSTFLISSMSCPYLCLPKSELVLMSNLKSKKPISEIVAGDMVASIDLYGNICPSRVLASRCTGHRSDIIMIRTSDNKVLRCTKNHRILTTTGWVEAGNLVIGDYIGVRQIQEDSQNKRKMSSISIKKYGEYKEEKKDNDSQQPYEKSRYQSKGKYFNQKTEQGNKRKNKKALGRWENNWSSYICEAKESCQRAYEEEQSNEESNFTSQGNLSHETETFCKSQNVRGKMVPETSWPKQSGIKDREIINSIGIQICWGREILDRPLRKREMSKSRFFMGERDNQSRSSIQFNVLAQSSFSQRFRDDERLSISRMESLCNRRENDDRYPCYDKAGNGLVGYSQITSIDICSAEYVYDIETSPHHNFIASDVVVHNCKFCEKGHEMYKQVIYRDPSHVVEELNQLKSEYGIQHVRFTDDCFTLNKKRTIELCQYVAKTGLTYVCITRTDRVDRDILQALADSGCTQIFYGIESGSQRILDAMQKDLTVEQNITAIKLTQEYGIKAKALLMIGYPGETEEDKQMTLDFVKVSQPDLWVLSKWTTGDYFYADNDPEWLGFKNRISECLEPS